MNKIAVGRSIARAYGFLFGRILTVLSLSWVAAAFFAALRYGLFQAGPISPPLSAHWQTASLYLAGILVAIALVCTIAIPLTREALGEREPWSLAHFVFGARELRLFLALIRLYLILIAVTAVAVGAVAGVVIGTQAALAYWPAAGQSGIPIVMIVRIAMGVVAGLAVLYVALRLSFFVYPVAAAEDHASLRAAWALAKGNVLRILLIVLAILVPVYVLIFAGEYALMGSALLDAAHTFFQTTPNNVNPLVSLFIAHAGSISIGAALLMVIVVSLTAGASAAAYRMVTGLETYAVYEEVEVALDDHAGAHAQEMHDEQAPAPEEHGEDHHGDDVVAHEEPPHEEQPHEDHPHAEEIHEEPVHEDHAHHAQASEVGGEHDAAYDGNDQGTHAQPEEHAQPHEAQTVGEGEDRPDAVHTADEGYAADPEADLVAEDEKLVPEHIA